MLRKLLLGLVGLVVLLSATAYLLPRTVSVQRTARVAAPPEVVFPIIATPAEWPKWSPWNQRDPNMEINFSGPPTGVGATWSWKSKSEGDGSMTFTQSIPSVKVAYELTIVGMGPPSPGAFLIAADPDGSMVQWSMTADMGNSPIGRWLGLLMPRWLGKDFEEGLASLSAYAATQPLPPPIIGIEVPVEPTPPN